MIELVPPEDIERIVGVTRRAYHVGRAVTAEQMMYILHSHECRRLHDTGERDLRECEFAQALNRGIHEWFDWSNSEDVPVKLGINFDNHIVPICKIEEEVMPKSWNHESRECAVCHRVGYRAFVISGSEGWRCLHEAACARRARRKRRSAS